MLRCFTLVSLLGLSLTLPSLALAQTCVIASIETQPQKQVGPTCLAASAAMALGGFGIKATPRDIARKIPMHTDGADFFDLQNELARRDFDTLVFQGGLREVATALKAGVPIIAALRRGSVKHAVLLVQAHGRMRAKRCGKQVTGISFIDPQGPQRATLKAKEFTAALYANQMMLVFPKNKTWRKKLNKSGFPLKNTVVQNARYRAAAWLLRAQKHDKPNLQQLELLMNARRETPCAKKIRRLVKKARGQLQGQGISIPKHLKAQRLPKHCN